MFENEIKKQKLGFGPKKLEDLLSEGFRIYKKCYARLWSIAALSGIINILFVIAIYGIMFFFFLLSEDRELILFLPYIVASGVFAFFVFYIVNVWVQCALIYFIAAHYLSDKVGFADSYKYAWSKLGIALVVCLVVQFIISILSLTIIGIPFAVYLGVSWCFVLNCILIEGASFIEAFSKSYFLVKGNWWRVLGINLMFAIIMFGVNSVAGMIPILGILISPIIATPIIVIGSVLLYFDLRTRKQDYTPAKLADELQIFNQ